MANNENLWLRFYWVAFFLLLAVLCIFLMVVLRYVRPAIVNVLSPLLVTITLMLQFDLLLLCVILCTSIGLLIAWRLRTHFQLYSLPVLITLIMGAYFDSSFVSLGDAFAEGKAQAGACFFQSTVTVFRGEERIENTFNIFIGYSAGVVCNFDHYRIGLLFRRNIKTAVTRPLPGLQ